jgi:hypothetical protein
MIDLLGEKTELIKQYKVWDHVKVSLNYRAREYDGRRFNSIGAWKIEWNGESSNGGDELPF